MKSRVIVAISVLASLIMIAAAGYAANRRIDPEERLAKIFNKAVPAQKAAPVETAAPTSEVQQTQQPADNADSPLTATTTSSIQTLSALAPASGEQIKWQVVSSGGGSSSSASFRLSSTIGQTAAGPISSASYKINQGFWQAFGGTSCCIGTRGNVNTIGIVDLSDLSMLIAYLIYTPRPTLPCPDAANVNAVGIIDLSDLSLLIAYLTSSPPPALPACP